MKTSRKVRAVVSAKKIIWYFCVLSMFCVCMITIAIVIANWKNIQIKIGETATVMMGIIGVLFGFSAISIYSIFNATIDAEKVQLMELQEELKNEMKLHKSHWDYSISLIRFYQTCQMIVESQSFNSQLFDWIYRMESYIESFRIYLLSLYENYDDIRFSKSRRDFMEICRGIRTHLNAFYHRIEEEKYTFFKNMTHEDINLFLNYLTSTIDHLERFEEYDYIISENKTKRIQND